MASERKDNIMDKNRFGAFGHQLKGTLKEGLGKLIGDAKLTADGAAEREAGETQNAAGAGADPMTVGGVDADRIAGVGHQLRGAFKEKLGDFTGDPKLVAAGIAEQGAGRAQNAIGSARDEARKALEDTREPIDSAEKTDAMIDTPKR
jgi:uncharacterized protein YjbJ (UPF0337 family)